MSPRISAAIAVILPDSARSIDRVRAAVRTVEAQGIRLASGGECALVERDEVTLGWVPDRGRRPIRVDLLGAILVGLQPITGKWPVDNAAAVAAAAVDTSPVWLQGLLDGWAGEPQVAPLLAPARQLYVDGLRAGGLLFAELTVECRTCGSRRYHGDPLCLPCPPRW